jgi:hypothetical protein
VSDIAFGVLLAAGAFLGTVVMIEVGRRHRRALIDRGADVEATVGLGAVEGAVFALMGLLVAFTFSGAAARFEARRTLIVDEANDLRTVYLRFDLLPVAARADLQERFRRYVDIRIEAYRLADEPDAAYAKLDEAAAMENGLWRDALAGCHETSDATCATLLLPALNEAFDLATMRRAAVSMHPPSLIFGLLIVVALACALLAGFSMGGRPGRSWPHVLGFAAILALTIYVTLDLEYPRLGLMRVSDFDRFIVAVRAAME